MVVVELKQLGELGETSNEIADVWHPPAGARSLQIAGNLTGPAACPALFTGVACERSVGLPVCLKTPFPGPLTIWRQPVSVDPRSYDKFAVNGSAQDLPDLPFWGNLSYPIKSCALVSSGGNLIGSKWGKRIDAHDMIARLNNAPVKGFEKDVGSKTHLRYTNGFYEGYRERPHEAVIGGKWCNKGAPCKKSDLTRVLEKKVHPMNPDFNQHTKTPYFKKVGHIPSAGFVASVILLHVCQKVNLFGFNILATKKKPHNMKTWYYEDTLWHKADERARRKIPDSAKFERKRWTVNEWTYVDTPPSSGGRGKKGRRLTQQQEDSAASQTESWKAAVHSPLRKQQRRLLGQSATIMVEKLCMQHLYSRKLLTTTER